MAEIVLNVEVRERTGTGGARVARREGLVPGVLYGGDKDPVAISVKMNEFKKALYTGKLLGHLVTLKHGAETQSVIAKAVDMHPVTDVPTHFDLYRVAADQEIKIGVAVHFAHQEESPGLKRGGRSRDPLTRPVSCARTGRKRRGRRPAWTSAARSVSDPSYRPGGPAMDATPRRLVACQDRA